MYHTVKDKSFSAQNPDPLRGIFYVRWERMDERLTLLYVVFVLPVLRAVYMTARNSALCVHYSRLWHWIVVQACQVIRRLADR
jgi:hypothetical protein